MNPATRTGTVDDWTGDMRFVQIEIPEVFKRQKDHLILHLSCGGLDMAKARQKKER